MYIIDMPSYSGYAHVKYTYSLHLFAHADVNYTQTTHVQYLVAHTWACQC